MEVVIIEFFESIRFDILWNYRSLFIHGIWITLGLTVVGYTCGIILGLLFGLGKMSNKKWIHYPSRWYIDFFRGTPLLVQILLIHIAVIPTIFGQSLGFFVSGALALSLNCGAYTAEIIRAGIQSLDKGQMEAARSLGMPHNMAMKHIILPQALRRMVPPLGNELIALLKDSSLVTVIAATDILYAAKIVQGATFRVWEPYILAAIMYLFLTYIVTKIVAYVEKRFSTSYVPSKRPKIFSLSRTFTGGR
ncbi:amino acid ABC transporter permease [Pseudogracilibacillus auburnensis]|uniref:Amino acid ABC transporter membrane protein (PAAT family) n=1 Tax=Pseudogracilibacillus auburnensis TaxID=1494959 RepID=A0A2V3WB45_9BACI|nr:amino acid ABC transporter permease [Pseudogracilibacillus auburnensis]MBO1005441.1 amino acid ABC transporter permease [Pseudogracilibacillus auburnensis]PXW90374.1 amino acid ABC transporter membrane protein (PAAT family) [Pseudogracilibacillus auburnensis]